MANYFEKTILSPLSSLRFSSQSANMKLKIGGIFNIGLLLVLKFSSLLKVTLMLTFFVHINLSFILLVFLDSPSSLDLLVVKA